MSGIKYSTVELEKEKKSKLELINSIENSRNKIQRYINCINEILQSLTVGARQKFSSNINQIKEKTNQKLTEYNQNMNSKQLQVILNEFKSAENDIKETYKKSIEIKEIKIKNETKSLFSEVQLFKTDLEISKSIFNKWEKDNYDSLVSTIDQLSNLIKGEEFTDAANLLLREKTNFNNLSEKIKELEVKDNMRNYVILSLKEVCKDMGWIQIDDARLEDSNNHYGPVIYKVNTLVAGETTFKISLNNIELESDLSNEGNACLDDFAKVSEDLKKIGVITKFEKVETNDDNRLNTNDAKDLDVIDYSFDDDIGENLQNEQNL